MFLRYTLKKYYMKKITEKIHIQKYHKNTVSETTHEI